MLPPGRYPEGGNGGGGNTADIENALPFAFAIPGIFFWAAKGPGGEGTELDIPDAESGRKRREKKEESDRERGREREEDTRPCNGGRYPLCDWRENRLARLVNDYSVGHTHASTVRRVAPGVKIISHSHFSTTAHRTTVIFDWLRS